MKKATIIIMVLALVACLAVGCLEDLAGPFPSFWA